MKNQTQYHISNEVLLTLTRSIYAVINQGVFSNELPNIPIKIQELEDGPGYNTAAAFCINQKSKPHHTDRISMIINSKIAYFSDFTALTVGIINYVLHEMVHEYCYLHGIVDVNHGTQYHNSQFMFAAEEHGLICPSYNKSTGFNQTNVQCDLAGDIVCQIPDEILIKMIGSATVIAQPR